MPRGGQGKGGNESPLSPEPGEGSWETRLWLASCPPILWVPPWDPRRETGKGYEQVIHERVMEMADNQMKGCSDSTVVREIKVKVARRYYGLPIRPASTNMEIKINAVGVGKTGFLSTASGHENCCSVFGKQSGNIDQK